MEYNFKSLKTLRVLILATTLWNSTEEDKILIMILLKEILSYIFIYLFERP